jgi:hypothetical protein
LKPTFSDFVAGYNCTGTWTRPKLIAPFQIMCAIVRSLGPGIQEKQQACHGAAPTHGAGAPSSVRAVL